MIIDKFSTFGSGLSIASADVIGDALDTGAVYGLGAGANVPPVLHIVCDTAVTTEGTLQVCTSDDGTAAGDVLMEIPVPVCAAEDVVFSGRLPVIPDGSGRYLVLKNKATAEGKVNAYILSNAPYHHQYKDKP